jgi:hypothetical protein
MLQTGDAIETGRGWVWTPFIVPLRTPELSTGIQATITRESRQR